MATFNNSHHETGGVILFQGELILLFCDNVNLSVVERDDSQTGRLYLTTHRMVFTNKSMRANLKSLSIPFYTMHDLALEQPIFGANYIKGKTRDENQATITFKLKFNSGGATEYGQALQNAARSVRNYSQQTAFQPPPAYTPSASQYYQAPPNVYQPAYNCGFALPNDIFNQPPPAGFIYTSEAPPPYPGLNQAYYPPQQGNGYAPQPGYAPQSGGYAPSQPVYPPTQSSAYPPSQQTSYPPQPGYPYQPGFPSQPGFAPQSGYYAPSQPAPGAAGYPILPNYQQPPSQPGYPSVHPYYPSVQQNQNQQSAYPNLNYQSGPIPSAPPPMYDSKKEL